MIEEYRCSICKKIDDTMAKRIITYNKTYYVCEECDKKRYYIHEDGRLLHRMGFGRGPPS